MKFPLRSDCYTSPENYRLDFQLWDKDLLTKNDYLSNVTVNAWPAVLGCIQDGRKFTMQATGNDDGDKGSSKLELKSVCQKGENKGQKSTLVVSIECLTKSE